MKITGLHIRIVEHRFEGTTMKRHGGAGSAELRMQYPLLTLKTDEGLEGHSMAYGIQGDGPSMAAMLRDMYFPLVEGRDPMESEAIWQELYRNQRHFYNNSDTLIGVLDVAIWDLRGKALGQPVANLLGRLRSSLPVYATARSRDYDEAGFAEEVIRLRDEGYHGYKLQVNRGPAWDIPRLRASREAVGNDFPLMHDPNSGYDFSQALEVGHVLDELDYAWYEEPISDRQIDLYGELARRLKTPMVPTETSMLFDLANYARRPEITFLRGDVLLKGGITGLKKAMDMAELFGKRLEVHAAAVPLLDLANLHVACACSATKYMESHHPMFRFGLIDSPLEIDREGMLHLPESPGLGAKIDWDWVEDRTAEVIVAGEK